MKSANPAYYTIMAAKSLEGGEAEAGECLKSVTASLAELPTKTLSNLRAMIQRKMAQWKRFAAYERADRLHGGHGEGFETYEKSDTTIKTWSRLETICRNEIASRIEKGEQL